MSKPLPNLEDSLAEMTQLIDKMEQGELSLEKSLTYFERGVTLVKHCQKILAEAEQKVNILTQNNAEGGLQPYPNEDTEDEDIDGGKHD